MFRGFCLVFNVHNMQTSMCLLHECAYYMYTCIQHAILGISDDRWKFIIMIKMQQKIQAIIIL